LIDCVNGWNTDVWTKAGFMVYRLGVNKLEIVNQKP
jgi:hypothetical protein